MFSLGHWARVDEGLLTHLDNGHFGRRTTSEYFLALRFVTVNVRDEGPVVVAPGPADGKRNLTVKLVIFVALIKLVGIVLELGRELVRGRGGYRSYVAPGLFGIGRGLVDLLVLNSPCHGHCEGGCRGGVNGSNSLNGSEVEEVVLGDGHRKGRGRL